MAGFDFGGFNHRADSLSSEDSGEKSIWSGLNSFLDGLEPRRRMDKRPKPAEKLRFPAVAYVCPVWDCLVNYASSGYFIAAKERDRVEQSTRPSICCPNDGTPMYLAALNPEHRSYRLWKCPQCGKSLTNLESHAG